MTEDEYREYHAKKIRDGLIKKYGSPEDISKEMSRRGKLRKKHWMDDLTPEERTAKAREMGRRGAKSRWQ